MSDDIKGEEENLKWRRRIGLSTYKTAACHDTVPVVLGLRRRVGVCVAGTI